MNPPPPAATDPVVRPVAVCCGKSGRPCGAPMNPIRIYEGKGTRPEMRGAICQSCSSCFWTVFHTPAYNYDDAQRLLHRLRYPGHATGYPADLRPPEKLARAPPPQSTPPALGAALQPAATQPIATQGNKIHCSNADCRTLSGTRTQGSKTCIENKCKRCCKQAALYAAQNFRARKQCHAHSQPELYAQQVTSPAAQAVSDLTQPQPPTQFVAQPLVQSVVSLPRSVIQPENSPAVAVPPPPPLPTQRRSLAQPMGGTWSSQHDTAVQKTQSLKSFKIQQHEIEERKKRTIMLIIYYLNGHPPLRLDQYIHIFPHFRLSACEELVKDLGLGENTRLDVWTGSEWITVGLHGIIPIEKGQRVILKIRSSLCNGLDDCPGIEEELKKEEKRGLKKPRVEFVSPVKKAPRTSTAPPAHPRATPPAAILRTYAESTAIRSTTPLPSESALPTQTRPKAFTLPSQPNRSAEAKLKHWPFDFYVYEIHNGLCQMRDTRTGSVSRDQHRKHQSKKSKGKRAKGRKITVEKAFRAAFPNTKWAKTTFYDHRKLWFEQDIAIRELFIDLGKSKEATYTHFLDTIDHPSRLPSPSPSDSQHLQPKKNTRSQKKRRRSPSTSSSDDSNSDSDESDSPSPQGKKTKRPHKKHCRSHSSSSSSGSSGDSDEEDICRAFNTPPPPADLTPTDDSIDPSLRSFLPASPSSINLEKLGERVANLREVLDEIVIDPEESGFFQSSRGTFTAGSSLHEDLGNFCQWNPAYYGTKGQTIIGSRLRELFPEVSFSKDIYHPLTWNAFIDEFLLPETLLLLIEEDKHISRDDALSILRETRSAAPKTPMKQEPKELLFGTVGTFGKLPQVIDLTDSPLAVKREPEDTEGTSSNWKGKGKAEDIIDLTMDSEEE
ncbi:hypothetical protein BDZ97DRAFT_1762698 [Flammula alnicola]|nr:hypothetical protein BDZ97DRAFT_1762698 [Flammula alnicola]